MASVNFTNSEQVVKEASEFFAKQAKIELQAKRPRTSIRAKWKKVGNSFQPVSNSRKTYRGNYVASGNLVRSIKPDEAATKNLDIAITMDWYAEAIQKGRKPHSKAEFRGGKGIPVSTMKNWARMKRLRPRDANGAFITNSQQNRKAMQILMNRKIKHFGIQPFDFVKIAENSMINKFDAKLREALRQDIQDSFR